MCRPAGRQWRALRVILWDDFGGFTVHADPGVKVFNRHDDPEIVGLYRYQSLPVTEGWLDKSAIELGDQLDDYV